MGTVYLESSALLTWMFGERRAGEIAALLDGADSVVTSSLTMVEVGRALARIESEGGAKSAAIGHAKGKLEHVRSGWNVFAMSSAIEERAGRPFPREPVRTLDAIHLATALECARAYDDVVLVTLDRRILENAEALGLV